MDYTIYLTVNGITYEGGSVDGVPYNRPIHTYPVAAGDVATIQIVTKDAATGTVYANMNVIANDASNAIKVKSTDYKIYVAAGETVYFQDDSLQASYATKDAVLSGDSVKDVVFYNVLNNANTGATTMKANTDTDGDDTIELNLGGSQGDAGVPAVKPAWAVENNSNVNKCFTLSLVDGAHECVYDDEADADCNSCGAIRKDDKPCEHAYSDECDANCDLCGEVREDVPHYPVGDYACNRLCCVCWADLTTADHIYSYEIDPICDVCGENRDVDVPFELEGTSVSEDVNGLAVRFNISAEGIANKNNTTEILYDNATFCGMKLVSMGAIVSNNYNQTNALPTMEDVNGVQVVNVTAKYLCDINKEEGTVSYAIRAIQIPENHKDTEIAFVPYLILEDAEGNQFVHYIPSWNIISSYNEAITY